MCAPPRRRFSGRKFRDSGRNLRPQQEFRDSPARFGEVPLRNGKNCPCGREPPRDPIRRADPAVPDLTRSSASRRRYPCGWFAVNLGGVAVRTPSTIGCVVCGRRMWFIISFLLGPNRSCDTVGPGSVPAGAAEKRRGDLNDGSV